MKTRKLNNQEKDIFASLVAKAVTEALDETSVIADLMKVDCKKRFGYCLLRRL